MDNSLDIAPLIFFGLFGLGVMAVGLVVAVGMIKTFSKMGYDDSWWLIVPILNLVFMLKVIDKPIWWIALFCVQFVGSVVMIYVSWMLSDKVAKAYGKDTNYALGLFFLGLIFYPLLGFGKEQPQIVN